MRGGVGYLLGAVLLEIDVSEIDDQARDREEATEHDRHPDHDDAVFVVSPAAVRKTKDLRDHVGAHSTAPGVGSSRYTVLRATFSGKTNPAAPPMKGIVPLNLTCT